MTIFASPVANKVLEVQVGTDIIEWSPPIPPHGDILYYNIKIIHQPSGDMELILGYNRTFASSDVWTNEWNVTDSFTIQARPCCMYLCACVVHFATHSSVLPTKFEIHSNSDSFAPNRDIIFIKISLILMQ